MAGKGKTGLWASYVLAIVVADRELCIWTLFVGIVNDANVAATEDGAFVWVISDGELGQVEIELLSHVEGKDEGFERFICRPLLLCWRPSNRRVSSDHFPELSLD